MKLEYSVHSVARGEATMTVKVNGRDREVRSDALVVELVREGSALTFRFDDVEEAEKLFTKAGKKITLSFAGAK